MKRRMCILLAFTLLTISCTAVYAGPNLFKSGDAEGPAAKDAWSYPVDICTADKKGGEASFETTRTGIVLTSNEFIQVDVNRKYLLSAFFKSASPGDPSMMNLGIAMFDKNRRNIIKGNVAVVPGTDTTLLKAAAKGDTSILITDGSKLERKRSVPTIIAFNTSPDYADLPNFDCSAAITAFKDNADGSCELQLSQPLLKAYPAGTALRQHLQGWTAAALSQIKVPAEWTEYKIALAGEAASGAPLDKFWRGTRYIKVFFMPNTWGKPGPRLLFDNLEFKEMER